MSNIHFDSLRVMVSDYIKQISRTDPESHSTEWFLLKYLRRIEKKTEPPSRTGQVEGTIRSMVRFYVDNIDEKSDLGDICIKIYNEHRKVLRQYQDNDHA
ncbi:MAG: hypothetical protein HKN08_10465 [Gammaproteobacteria bacterium]|nr:hypothetical protein [Gammaproteobacteria bacterium]